MPIKREDTPVVAAARARAVAEAVDEYRRLLYVAMTRAADRLVICGSVGERRRPQGCWYDLIAGALTEHCSVEPAEVGDGTVLRYRKVAPEPEQPSLDLGDLPSGPPRVPDWLTQAASVEAAPVVPLSPSQAYDEAEAPAPRFGGAGRRAAMARGATMHRLLQSLPELPPERRAEAARRHLARKIAELGNEECERMAAGALAVTEDPRFVELFAAGSRAEAPIVGRIVRDGRTFAVSGVVDRLVVTENAVLIADYKTNRPPPRSLAAVPGAYLAQLALYRAVLAQLYPGKTIRTALIWTEIPDLMEIPGAALDAALARLAVPSQP
jgi:ATP-dependent helicase/nuclease subunit A